MFPDLPAWVVVSTSPEAVQVPDSVSSDWPGILVVIWYVPSDFMTSVAVAPSEMRSTFVVEFALLTSSYFVTFHVPTRSAEDAPLPSPEHATVSSADATHVSHLRAFMEAP